MTPEEVINKECQRITNDINNLISEAEHQIKTASERARTAEDMLLKIKEATAQEIKKAFAFGYQQGIKSKDVDNTGGTQKTNEDFKLVLEN